MQSACSYSTQNAGKQMHSKNSTYTLDKTNQYNSKLCVYFHLF